MNERDRFLGCMRFEEVDRVPVMDMGVLLQVSFAQIGSDHILGRRMSIILTTSQGRSVLHLPGYVVQTSIDFYC